MGNCYTIDFVDGNKSDNFIVFVKRHFGIDVSKTLNKNNILNKVVALRGLYNENEINFNLHENIIYGCNFSIKCCVIKITNQSITYKTNDETILFSGGNHLLIKRNYTTINLTIVNNFNVILEDIVIEDENMRNKGRENRAMAYLFEFLKNGMYKNISGVMVGDIVSLAHFYKKHGFDVDEETLKIKKHFCNDEVLFNN